MNKKLDAVLRSLEVYLSYSDKERENSVVVIPPKMYELLLVDMDPDQIFQNKDIDEDHMVLAGIPIFPKPTKIMGGINVGKRLFTITIPETLLTLEEIQYVNS